MTLNPSGASRSSPERRALTGSALVLSLAALAWALGSPVLTPPLGVSAHLLASDPLGRASHPRNVLAGHLIGLLAGFAAVALAAGLVPPGLPASLWDAHVALASFLAVALTALLGERLGVPHPPATATTLLVSLGLLHRPGDALALFFGALVLALVAWIVRSRHLRSGAGAQQTGASA